MIGQFFLSIRNFFLLLYRVTGRVYQKLNKDNLFIVSHGLSFKTLFAIIPVSAVLLSVFSAFPSFMVYKDRAIQLLMKFIVPESIPELNTLIDQFLQNTRTIGIIGTIGVIFISLDLFMSLDNEINKIWDMNHKRSLIHRILLYWAFITITPIFFIAYFYYSAWISATLQIQTQISVWMSLYYELISFIIVFIFIIFIYLMIPNRRIRFFRAIPIALVIGLLLTVFKKVFSYYTRLFITNWEIYGSIAGILFFLFWIYLNWFLILSGVELTAIWEKRLYRGSFNQVKNYFLLDLVTLILILKLFYKEFNVRGKGVTADFLSEKTNYSRYDIDTLLNAMESENLIVPDHRRHRFTLKTDIKRIRLSQLKKVLLHKRFYQNYPDTPDFIDTYHKLNRYFLHSKENVSLKEFL